MLTIGVNVFPALPNSSHLAFTAQDAEDLARTWKTRCANNYAHMLVHTVSDNSTDKPNKKNILNALRFAEQAGRRLLIVDTCQARSIEGNFGSHSLMKRSAASQFALIVASKGNKESQEYLPEKHGLFPFALLSSLKADADANKDGRVALKEAFDFARPIVEKLCHKETGPQTPQMVAPLVLAEMSVMRAGLRPGRKKEGSVDHPEGN